MMYVQHIHTLCVHVCVCVCACVACTCVFECVCVCLRECCVCCVCCVYDYIRVCKRMFTNMFVLLTYSINMLNCRYKLELVAMVTDLPSPLLLVWPQTFQVLVELALSPHESEVQVCGCV